MERFRFLENLVRMYVIVLNHPILFAFYIGGVAQVGMCLCSKNNTRRNNLTRRLLSIQKRLSRFFIEPLSRSF